MPFKATKDPQAKLDFGLDWTAWLGVDNITTSTWTADTGLTLTNATYNAKTTTVWIAGGTAGEKLSATNRIITAAGRQDERTIILAIKEM